MWIDPQYDEFYRGMHDKPITPSAFEGFGDAMALGLKHSRALFNLASSTKEEDTLAAQKAIRDTRPDPYTMGTASNIAYSLTNMIGQAVQSAPAGAVTGAAVGGAAGSFTGPGALASAGAGAVAGAGYGAVAGMSYLTMLDVYEEMTDKGVSHDEALKASGLSGAVMAVGAGLPAFIGKTLVKQVATGVALNSGLGMVERSGTAAILADKNPDVAAHYKALDAQALATDALMGAIFPLGARALRIGKGANDTVDIPAAKQETLDAATMHMQGTMEQIRNPHLETSFENIERTRAGLDEATQQIMAEGRTLSQMDLPRLADDVVANPIYDRMIRVADDAVDEMLVRDLGLSRADIIADLGRAAEIDSAVRKSISAKLMEQSETGIIGKEGEILHDMFAASEVKAIAKAYPDMTIDVDGKQLTMAEYVKHVDNIEKDATDKTALHNVAISCFLTHGA